MEPRSPADLTERLWWIFSYYTVNFKPVKDVLFSCGCPELFSHVARAKLPQCPRVGDLHGGGPHFKRKKHQLEWKFESRKEEGWGWAHAGRGFGDNEIRGHQTSSERWGREGPKNDLFWFSGDSCWNSNEIGSIFSARWFLTEQMIIFVPTFSLALVWLRNNRHSVAVAFREQSLPLR